MTCESIRRALEMDGVEGLGEAERAHIAQCSRCASSVRAVEAVNASMRKLSRVSSKQPRSGPENSRLLVVVAPARRVGRLRSALLLVVVACTALLAAIAWQDWRSGTVEDDPIVMSQGATDASPTR